MRSEDLPVEKREVQLDIQVNLVIAPLHMIFPGVLTNLLRSELEPKKFS